MFVVPVRGDKIKTKDDSDPRVVSSYSSLKDQPAVYLVASTSKDPFLFFSDIVEINGVTVEYDSSSKVFKSLGTLRRKYDLPQPGDTITVKLMDVSYKNETEEIEVDSIKLHSQKYGVGKGLLICGQDAGFTLPEILDTSGESQLGDFKPDAFQKYYFDYLPIGLKGRG